MLFSGQVKSLAVSRTRERKIHEIKTMPFKNVPSFIQPWCRIVQMTNGRDNPENQSIDDAVCGQMRQWCGSDAAVRKAVRCACKRWCVQKVCVCVWCACAVVNAKRCAVTENCPSRHALVENIVFLIIIVCHILPCRQRRVHHACRQLFCHAFQKRSSRQKRMSRHSPPATQPRP